MRKLLSFSSMRFNSLIRNQSAKCLPSFYLVRTFTTGEKDNAETESDSTLNGKGKGKDHFYDGGSDGFSFKRRSSWEEFKVKTKLTLFAYPWQRFKNGSVLKITLRGQITEQLISFSRVLSLPQICDNFEKAAYDPRIMGIYLHIDNLSCGWGKLDEIRRHILAFKKSGKFVIGYMPTCGMKEYYIASACDELYAPPSGYVGLYGFLVQASFVGGVLEKVGVEPHVEKVGKFKSLGDQITRKSMTDENREMLTALLDKIYGNWLVQVSRSKGKRKEDLEKFIDEGVYQVERLKEEGFITDVKYDDEVISMVKTRLNIPSDDDVLPSVNYSMYSRVSRWALGLTGSSKDRIAIIRASGNIRRVQGVSRSNIVAEQFIEKIRRLKGSKKFKAVIIRIDSPGGDALASDLMWKEIKALAKKVPVIASMSDVAASGGYYMAMAADSIVAENLTLTGSIGVITGKFSLGKLYDYIGFNKEIISRGKYAELMAAEQRPFSADEAELFAKRARDMYEQFVSKAAISRSMKVDQIKEIAQGRVWTGSDAAVLGLVDGIGGLSTAVAIAKEKANIPLEKPVTLVELSRSSPSLFEAVRSMRNTFRQADGAVEEILHQITSSAAEDDGSVQARMDGILFEKLGTPSHALTLLRDCLRSSFV